MKQAGRTLFVSHDASRTGAPIFLLNLLRWIKANTALDFEVLLPRGGPLVSDFANLCRVSVVRNSSSYDGQWEKVARGIGLEKVEAELRMHRLAQRLKS